MRNLSILFLFFGLTQLLYAASVGYEPMVAFICGRPSMHRGVNGWIADSSKDCLTDKEKILNYCRQVYPNHNITNVVENTQMVTVPDWPMGTANRKHKQRVRPFRCLVGAFQSDALLVPQHCEFDHVHDQAVCEGFSHWNVVADNSCRKKGKHLESFGLLLSCKELGIFSGVEYVCCPNPVDPTVKHPDPEGDDKPDKWQSQVSAESQEADGDDDDADSDYDDESDESYDDDSEDSGSYEEEQVVDLYEAYLRQQPFPARYDNEHKKYLAAKERMRKNQQRKTATLLQEWQVARENVEKLRKADPNAADIKAEEISTRFKHLYEVYEKEDEAEKDQLVALHQQHVQANLNEKKRDAMEKYLNALESGDTDKITKFLHSYIKVEEKDRMHTVNHFEHIKYSAPHEALRIHPFIVKHLKLSEQRIDQALEMLTRYPDIEVKVRPEVEEFLKRFNSIATSIRDVVLPVPEVEDENKEVEEEDSQSQSQDDDFDNVISDSSSSSSSSSSESDSASTSDSSSSEDMSLDSSYSSSEELDEEGDDIRENEHDFEETNKFVAHSMQDTHGFRQSLTGSSVSNSQVGSTIGIALGSVSVFVIIVVAVIMLRRNNNNHSQQQGNYVEVDPSASPEERHLANMQMNGYENPTYKYFEVQSNPKA